VSRRPAVVILRALGLGDFLTGVPAYRALRGAYPDHEIVLAAPKEFAPLASLTGAIDRVLPTAGLEAIRWQAAAPAVAVDLHGNGPASHRLVHALGARAMMVYASAADPGAAGPWWVHDEHEVSRWCRLVEWYGAAADRAALLLARPLPAARRTGAVIVHPGAASASRRWPADRFAAVARALAGTGRRVIVTGTAAERGLALRVALAAGTGRDSVAAGRTSLPRLTSLVAAAPLVISNDTGIAHVAVAFGTPSVTLFGPVSPALWGPPTTVRRHVALWKGGAAGRPGDAHGSEPDPRLLWITPEEVLAAAEPLLRRTRTTVTATARGGTGGPAGPPAS
jgi:ADP-heptose:LPS heptosyltransferase